MGTQLNNLVSECKVISLPSAVARRNHMNTVMDNVGLEFSYFDGVISSGKRGCTISHFNALSAIERLPALILEDDVTLWGNELSLPTIPSGTDIVYLAVTQFGCLRRFRPYVREYGHKGFYRLGLSSSANSEWLRLHSMCGMFAILYLTERGVQIWRNAARAGMRHRSPVDVFTAYAMNSLNVLTPHYPLFCEAAGFQRPTKAFTLDERLSMTTTPLSPREEGEESQIVDRNQKHKVVVKKTGNNKLDWELCDSRE